MTPVFEDSLSSSPDRVIAVIVAFSPDPERFAKVLAAAQVEASRTVIVDNGKGQGISLAGLSGRCERIDMGGNCGVAAAQNAGIRHAFKRGGTHVLLLDHDSVLQPGTVKALLRAWRAMVHSGTRVAAVGADYRDPRRPNVSPFIRIDGLRMKRVVVPADATTVKTTYLISSGSLISREAFDTIGPMKESFFVDYVDIEWGFRASARGWECFGVADAKLDHLLGDAPLKIFRGSYPLHSPTRHYYMARNAVWLITRSRIPMGCRVAEGWRLLRRCVAYALFAPEHRQHANAIFYGIKDGLQGRLGFRMQVNAG